MSSEFVEDETTRVSVTDRRLKVPQVELVVESGPSRGERFVVQSGQARMGSAPGNDLRLNDETVSRFHCEIALRPSGITLRDRASTNGTFIAGLRIREADIPAGALVTMGNSVVRVDRRAESTFIELSSKKELGLLVGQSPAMRELFALIERVAPTDTTVLVTGETGTGKDVVARTLHAFSKRAKGPFVPVDCGAIPEHLIESELFGHVRGAFTGATSDRRGVFEEAHEGTLFLDEIGELPLALQPKLLRALETRSIRAVGASTSKQVDVRVVAATNRPLARCVNEGTFREDLYFRLAVVELGLTPLRERPEDIRQLAERFYKALTASDNPLPEAFFAQLASRSWPGNIRELRNVIERSVSLGLIEDNAESAKKHADAVVALDERIPLHLPLKEAREAWMRSFELLYARAMLERTGGNITRAAEAAGVSRRFLQRMLARLGDDSGG
jgi:transcriptional regulator with PAS, ATPase and Fis domain